MKWHKGLGLDTLVTRMYGTIRHITNIMRHITNNMILVISISDYEDHAHLAYFLKNRERIQSIQDPIAQSRYLPWHKNYSSVSHDYLNLAGWYQ